MSYLLHSITVSGTRETEPGSFVVSMADHQDKPGATDCNGVKSTPVRARAEHKVTAQFVQTRSTRRRGQNNQDLMHISILCPRSDTFCTIPQPRDSPFTASPAPSISLSSPSVPLRVRGIGRKMGLTSPKEGRSMGLEVKLTVPRFTCRELG
jgi:hypothetical protein